MGQDNVQFETEIETSDFYIWEAPGRNVSIHLHYDVVDRLLGEVMRGFGSVPRRGAEVGGLLLGTAVLSERLVVRVEDIEPVPIEYSRGPSYLFSENDRLAFEGALAQRQPELDRPVYTVGFFRSHTREDLGLTPEDLDLFARYFTNPTDVALLIKPYITKPSVAGFYFREGDRIETKSYLDFPLRRLDPGGSPRRTRGRPQVDQEAAADSSGQAAPTGFEPEAETPAPPEQTRTRRRNLWIPLAFLFLILGVLLGFQTGLITRWKGAPQYVGDTGYGLDLSVEKSGDALHLTWNPQAAVLRKARRGVLIISDGDFKNTVNVEPADLQGGNLIYRNQTPVVRFRFELPLSSRNTIVETLEYRGDGSRPAAAGK